MGSFRRRRLVLSQSNRLYTTFENDEFILLRIYIHTSKSYLWTPSLPFASNTYVVGLLFRNGFPSDLIIIATWSYGAFNTQRCKPLPTLLPLNSIISPSSNT